MKRAKRIFLACIAVVLLYGCGPQSAKEGEEDLSFVYISKDLEHYWFQQVSSGIESKCRELGITFQSYNADYDDAQCIAWVKQAVKDGCDGLMICVTNQQLGSEIAEICKKAEVPVVTIDDSMKDDEGKEFPYVGMATREVAAIGGVGLTRLAKEKDFPVAEGKIKILELDVPELSVFRERLTGYEEALFINLGLEAEDVVTINVSTGMYQSNYDEVKAYFDQNPLEEDTYWIICGVNDDSALAPMHVLRDMGCPAEQVIACGLGGYELSIQEFEEQNTYYITVMTQPDVEGAKAVEMLYDYLKEGKELDKSIILGGSIATCDNYMIYFNDSNRVSGGWNG